MWKWLPGEKSTWETDVPGIVCYGWWQFDAPPEANFHASPTLWPPDSVTIAYMPEPQGDFGGEESDVGFVCLGDLDDPLRYIDEDRQSMRMLHRSVAASIRY